MKKIYLVGLLGMNMVLATLTGSAFATQTANNAGENSLALQQVITNAIQQFEQTSRMNWSYRISRYENEEGDISSSIELFDPTKAQEQHWSLLSINGQEPTEKQAQKFVKDKLKRAKERDQQSFSLKLRELIQTESLRKLSEDAQILTASFDVYLSRLGENASESLKGSLVFNKEQQFIESIEINNTKPFSPMFSAEINQLKLTLRFTKIGTSVLPQQHELTMKGSFAIFTEIDEVSTDTFGDYRYVGE